METIIQVVLDTFLPAIAPCQVFGWWYFCRVKPKGRNCWLPWNC